MNLTKIHFYSSLFNKPYFVSNNIQYFYFNKKKRYSYIYIPNIPMLAIYYLVASVIASIFFEKIIKKIQDVMKKSKSKLFLGLETKHSWHHGAIILKKLCSRDSY
ncbi:Uncharacterised protein [Staphylococcus aureus]|nr:Uncharacterised protein [Staphylococcus aureus]